MKQIHASISVVCVCTGALLALMLADEFEEMATATSLSINDAIL